MCKGKSSSTLNLVDHLFSIAVQALHLNGGCSDRMELTLSQANFYTATLAQAGTLLYFICTYFSKRI